MILLNTMSLKFFCWIRQSSILQWWCKIKCLRMWCTSIHHKYKKIKWIRLHHTKGNEKALMNNIGFHVSTQNGRWRSHISRLDILHNYLYFPRILYWKEKFIKTCPMIKDLQSKLTHPYIHVNHLNGHRWISHRCCHIHKCWIKVCQISDMNWTCS